MPTLIKGDPLFVAKVAKRGVMVFKKGWEYQKGGMILKEVYNFWDNIDIKETTKNARQYEPLWEWWKSLLY